MDCSHQAPLSVGFSRQQYWSGLQFPSPGHLPNPGIEPGSLTLQADALPSEPVGNLFNWNKSGGMFRNRGLGKQFKAFLPGL